MKRFSEKINEKFIELQKTGKLFRSSLPGSNIWKIYLTSFGKDGVFRSPESSEHNCNHCNNFIRRYGNIVAINSNYEIETMFDVELDKNDEYYNFVKLITKELKSNPIQDVFVENFEELKTLPYETCKKTNTVFRLGVAQNHKIYTKEEADKYGGVIPGKVYEFNHFWVNLNKEFVDFTSNSVESIIAKFRDDKNVFIRGLNEISIDTLLLVKDLINQGSLLNGESYLSKLDSFIKYKKQFDLLSVNQKDNYCWVTSYKLPFAKFRNELIGTLCVELTEGKELNEACKTWNVRVDPVNYMKAKSPITQNQINQAQQFVVENGYEESFDRRFATLNDISVEEILHVNVGEGNIKNASIFDKVKSTTPSTRHKRSQFDGIEEVSIYKFMKDILPTCTSIETFFEAKHQGNLVALMTANNKQSKQMFKWNNNFSWTYNGNLAGKSQLAQMVEAKGGRTDGAFRFTHSWNELEPNQSLMDLHVFMPGCQIPDSNNNQPNVVGRRVGWNHRQDPQSGGKQDVDYTAQAPIGYVPVENITFPDINKMPEGVYTCKIHNWSFRNTGGRGKAEIAFGGQTFEYIYPATKNHDWVTIAEVTLKNGQFTIKHHIEPVNETSKTIWNIETNQFHKVNLVCLSPNFWGDNNIGNRHYFFMLDKCKSDTPLRSFHNEYLNSELLQHRKVTEVLANTTMLEPAEHQLCGLGYNSTVKDEIILKLNGTHKRTIKVTIG